jgi:tight adherence protein B
MAVPIIVLALIMMLGLMFYERSRRADLRKQEHLDRRISGTYTMPESQAGPPGETKEPRLLPSYVLELLRSLERWLAQAGIEMPVQQFLLVTLLSGLVGFLLTALRVKVGLACFSGIGFAALPTVYALVKRKRRLATFSEQLPYVADFLRSALRAGHPLARGLQMAAENAPEPMATELRLTIDQMHYGASLPDALDGIFRRVPEESLGFFVAAVRVQAQVGSSLAEILDRVADAIRARQRLRQQIKTLTAQARMSGLIVGALPFFLLVVFTIIRPEYSGLLFKDPSGNKILAAAIVMDLIALFIINRMVQV